MTTRIGLGSILGQLRHLPIEIIARIKEEADITKKLEKISRIVNRWVLDVEDWMHNTDDAIDWVLGLAKGVKTIRQRENSIRRLRE